MIDFVGRTIHSILNNTYQITKKIGQGAQGETFLEYSGEYVIKILSEKNAATQTILETKLKTIFQINLPTRFIKPIDIVRETNPSYVGYVMKRVKGHDPLNRILIPPIDEKFGDWYNTKAGGLKRRLYLGYQIAQSFALLHKIHLAYCDISGNNILVASNPKINSVCMIDIDNVYTPGTVNNNIAGTARYIAPEIYKKQLPPDVVTDDYSLAVILFELLRCGHPYVGDVIADGSPEIEQAAYQGMFPYIDDNETEQPNFSSDALPCNVIFTNELNALFRKTFINGKNNRMDRATAKDYSIACLEASNDVICCKNCGAWYYSNLDYSEYKGNEGSCCPWCVGEDDGGIFNKVGPHIVFGELFPKFNDGTEKFTSQWKYDKRFILHEGDNYITNNYIRRVLTSNDYVKTSSDKEVEGNIKTYFELVFTLESNTGKLINKSEYPIFIRSPKEKIGHIIKPEKSGELIDGTVLYFDPPSNKKISFDDVVTGSPSAVSHRIATLRLNREGI